jgi:putative transposase
MGQPYTKEEAKAIKKAQRTTKNPAMQRKFLVLRLHMKGLTNKKIAEIADLSQHTVGIYINTYKKTGMEGLVPKKSPGRPHFLNESQERHLYETISSKTPDDVGFDGMMNWTAKLACLWVENEYGIKYSTNGMLDMFHRLNLSYTRPTYVLTNADPEKQEQFKKDFEVVKKTDRWRNIPYIV